MKDESQCGCASSISCALVRPCDDFSGSVASASSSAYGPDRRAGTYGFAFLGFLAGWLLLLSLLLLSSLSGRASPDGRFFDDEATYIAHHLEP